MLIHRFIKRSMFFFIGLFAIVLIAFNATPARFVAAEGNNDANFAIAAGVIQCDEACVGGYVQLGVLPPITTAVNRNGDLAITPGMIQCDESCISGHIRLGMIPPPATN